MATAHDPTSPYPFSGTAGNVVFKVHGGTRVGPMVCIIVVEDESDIRELLVDVLTDEGFEIIQSATADEAVALLDDPRVRLLVTDINLPGRLDGIALAIAARKRCPCIPIVFVSGRPNKLEDARVMGHPVVFLQKPFSLKMLVADVQRLVDA